MASDRSARINQLMALREEIFSEMSALELQMADLRVRIERLESEQRLGGTVTEEYETLKGHALPRAETRLVELYGALLKLEQKIRECGLP